MLQGERHRPVTATIRTFNGALRRCKLPLDVRLKSDPQRWQRHSLWVRLESDIESFADDAHAGIDCAGGRTYRAANTGAKVSSAVGVYGSITILKVSTPCSLYAAHASSNCWVEPRSGKAPGRG